MLSFDIAIKSCVENYSRCIPYVCKNFLKNCICEKSKCELSITYYKLIIINICFRLSDEFNRFDHVIKFLTLEH